MAMMTREADDGDDSVDNGYGEHAMPGQSPKVC